MRLKWVFSPSVIAVGRERTLTEGQGVSLQLHAQSSLCFTSALRSPPAGLGHPGSGKEADETEAF